MLDFAVLPPEIISMLIYAGPGSAPLMAAATAWNHLAAELGTTAASYQSVVSTLASEEWQGPASARMSAAAAPYVAWMNTTAAQAQQAATQAIAAAAAFEAVHTTVVPPAAVHANRAELATLVATNVLGQNAALIAANQALYATMWATDAAAMYAYAAASSIASQLTLFTEPAQNTNPAAPAMHAAALGNAAGTTGSQTSVAQVMSTLPGMMQSMSSPLSATASASPMSTLGGMLSSLAPNPATDYWSVILNGISSGGATALMYIPSTLLPSMLGYFAGPGFNAAEGGVIGTGLGSLLAPGGPLGNLGALGGGISAGTASAVTGSMGAAPAVGGMSVPAGWASATPANGAVSAAMQGTGWTTVPETNSVAAMPGGIPGAGAGRGSFGFGTPRYGFKPTVMGRPVIAG